MRRRPAAIHPPVPRRGFARVVAVASGKGGVGKTNIAANLGIALARRGLRIVLVDADLGTANVDVILNVRSRWDLSHVLRRQRSVEEVAIDVEPGLRLIVGASGLASVTDLDPLERAALIEDLATLESACDVLLLDCGAGISQNVLAFAQAADELLVVTTPEPTALTDAYALIKVLSRRAQVRGEDAEGDGCSASGPLFRLVVNQAASLREGRLVADRIAGTAARFLGVNVELAGQILRDPRVPLAVRQRVPFIRRYPRSPAASCLAALAERVGRPCSRGHGESGFFRRLVGVFY
jgi:flagellar biosynthesis protein FlhG